jgi:hypothetical protein
VLIAGGSTDGSTPLNTAEIYATTGGSFSASNSTLNTPRFSGTATLLPNGMVLLVGGASGSTAELYDPDSDKFDATGSLLKADQPSLTATLLNQDHVLITGLTSSGSPVADAELYTPSFDPSGTVGLSSSDTSAMPDSFGAACVLTVSGAGVSTCTSTVTPAEVGSSPHTITGTYPADSVHSGNTASAPLTVNKADTTTSVISSLNPSTQGQAVTFTATVGAVSPGAGTPTGTVTFEDGGVALAGSSIVNLSGGTASFTTTALMTGTQQAITAVYSGDSNFNATGSDAGSTANTLTQAVAMCTSNCAVGLSCTSDANCTSNACDGVSLVCDANQCTDHRKDGNETDIDCGGGTCPACPLGLGCNVDTDCTSNACDAVSLTCVANQCADHRQDGNETGIDCGGGTCPACPLGLGCNVDTDCTSNACDALSLTCVANQCADHRQDGNETDVDCGGGTCSPCSSGQHCVVAGDCTSLVCNSGVCQ